MKLPASLGRALGPLARWVGPRWECPVCGAAGSFRRVGAANGARAHAACPKCGALERHRLQKLVLDAIRPALRLEERSVLHFAPERCLAEELGRARRYETADVVGDVTHRVDLRRLPFADASWDVIFASHVLEHVDDDGAALREIRRVLAPDGVAILPVPVVQERTVEYPGPNESDHGHVRAPGVDYFERYREHFARVDVHASHDFPERYQTFVYEDRTGYPTPSQPLKRAMAGERHADYVPVCWCAPFSGA